MTERKASPGLRLALDYAPLLVFFAVNFLAPGAAMVRLVAATTRVLPLQDQVKAVVLARVICATTAFVIASIIAVFVSRLKLGRVSPMLWIAGVLVVLFGGLTIYFADPRFIQMKPSFVYAIFAGILGVGLATGRPLLQGLLESSYPGLSDTGWRKLTRNWALFFAGMALLNEAVRWTVSFDAWLAFKLWGAIPLTLGFAIANVPMLMRHGLAVDEDRAATDELPPE